MVIGRKICSVDRYGKPYKRAENGISPHMANLKRLVMAAKPGTESVRQAMKSAKHEITDREATALILACRKGKKWQRAVEIYRVVRVGNLAAKGAPGFFTFSAVISVCCRSRRLSEALELLSEMEVAARDDPSLEPDTIVFRNVISCSVKKEKNCVAIELFDHMVCKGIQPDDQTLALIVAACLRERLWRKATDVLDIIHARGGVLHVSEYEKFMEACAVEGSLGIVAEVLIMMQMVDVEPSWVILAHVMDAVEKEKCPLVGLELLESIQESGMKVPSMVYSGLIKAIHSTQSFELMPRLAEMLECWPELNRTQLE